MIKRTITDKN